jgi:hypothetical protein
MNSDMLTIDQIMTAFRSQLEKVAVNGKIKLTTRTQFDVIGKKAWDMLDIMLADSFEQEQKEDPKAPKIEEQKQEKKIDYKKIFEKKVQDYEDDSDDESDDDGEESDDDDCDDCDGKCDCDDEDDTSDEESDEDESDKELDMNKEEEKALDWLFIEWDVYDKDIEGKMDIDKLQGLLSSKVKSRAKKLKVNLFADKKYLIVKFNIGKKEQEEKVDIKKFTKRYEKKGSIIHNFILNKM